ncbi:DUF1799 domain-containing protein [Nitratiruptor sp. YY08-26]|uniref:DUF1799 domain-containing protein n=1 Tax=Nitratiruptor sp. YY08-26 TaxID=2724900 RepID=UPI00353050F3
MPESVQEIVDFFHKINTQWRIAPMGGVIGLDYMAVIEIARIYEFELTTFAMDVIREMERFYIERQNNGSR